MASSHVKAFVDMCNYLQEPCHVARFQKICGVIGSFPIKSKNPDRGESGPDNPGLRRRVQQREQCSDVSMRNGSVGDSASPQVNGMQSDKPARPESTSAAATSAAATSAAATSAAATFAAATSVAATAAAATSAAATSAAATAAAATAAAATSAAATAAAAATSVEPDTVRSKPLRKNSLTEEVGQEFLIHNKFFFYLFTFGTELGNEMFFIIFFPFLFWNVDALVSRRLIIVWAWNLFLGQSTKDMVRWSRPASPPVVKVEVFYNSEYSMPSTHAMTGTAIPFCLFMLTYGRWQYTFFFGLCVALCWSLLVCVSRVYMGMHSVLEVITGFLYTLLILAILCPLLDTIDSFYMTERFAPLAILLTHVSLGLVAFSLDSWSTSRGDTAQALGTGAGAALATHVNYQTGLLLDPPLSSLPLDLHSVSINAVVLSMLRFFIGVAVLLLTRTVMKAVTIPFLCRVFGLPSGNVRQARQRMRVELPYRYIVYSVVGFSCVCVVPLLFRIVNLA